MSSLIDFVDGNRDDMLLYPTRVLRSHLSRTDPYCPSCASLFVSVAKRKTWLSQNTISFRIKSIIIHGYDSVTDDDCRLVKVNVHEVWKIVTSLLFGRNSTVQHVLNAGTWPSQTTFSAFYLRNVTYRYMDTFSVAPVVVAQEVMRLIFSFGHLFGNSSPGCFAAVYIEIHLESDVMLLPIVSFLRPELQKPYT